MPSKCRLVTPSSYGLCGFMRIFQQWAASRWKVAYCTCKFPRFHDKHPGNLHFKHRIRDSNCDLMRGDWWCALQEGGINVKQEWSAYCTARPLGCIVCVCTHGGGGGGAVTPARVDSNILKGRRRSKSRISGVISTWLHIPFHPSAPPDHTPPPSSFSRRPAPPPPPPHTRLWSEDRGHGNARFCFDHKFCSVSLEWINRDTSVQTGLDTGVGGGVSSCHNSREEMIPFFGLSTVSRNAWKEITCKAATESIDTSRPCSHWLTNDWVARMAPALRGFLTKLFGFSAHGADVPTPGKWQLLLNLRKQTREPFFYFLSQELVSSTLICMKRVYTLC